MPILGRELFPPDSVAAASPAESALCCAAERAPAATDGVAGTGKNGDGKEMEVLVDGGESCW